eukprot:6948692-Pyramimonas_sp.AAC.1
MARAYRPFAGLFPTLRGGRRRASRDLRRISDPTASEELTSPPGGAARGRLLGADGGGDDRAGRVHP